MNTLLYRKQHFWKPLLEGMFFSNFASLLFWIHDRFFLTYSQILEEPFFRQLWLTSASLRK